MALISREKNSPDIIDDVGIAKRFSKMLVRIYLLQRFLFLASLPSFVLIELYIYMYLIVDSLSS